MLKVDGVNGRGWVKGLGHTSRVVGSHETHRRGWGGTSPFTESVFRFRFPLGSSSGRKGVQNIGHTQQDNR